jgi:hypothetical protein
VYIIIKESIMADVVLKKIVRLLPMRGVYYETSLAGYGPQSIWKVLPGNEKTKIWGTPVIPSVAYSLLMLHPAVVKIGPAGPGEESDLTKVFTPEQFEAIKNIGEYGSPTVSRSSRNQSQKDFAPVDTKTAKIVEGLIQDVQAVKEQNKLLTEQNQKMGEAMARLISQATSKAAPAASVDTK